MIGKFIGIEGASATITVWIEDLDTHEVSQIGADPDVFIEQILGVFPGGSFAQKTVQYEVNAEGMLIEFRAVEDE